MFFSYNEHSSKRLDLDNDIRMIDNYTKLEKYNFRRFKKN